MTITVNCRCPLCGKTTLVSCADTAWEAYEHGALAQEAFADMDLATRETIISGMCEPCQLQFFIEDDDEDCDGECDICFDFDCPANASYFNPHDEE